MNPERYRRAGDLYHAALALPADRRQAFLDRACAGDEEMRGEVESLLAAHEEAGDYIENSQRDVNALLESILGGGEPAASHVAVDSVPGGPLEPGQQLGRYQLLDLLGTGGMGRVYRALDPHLGREVAIKALARTFQGDSASLRRFEREARLLATLSHPNIATIFGFERVDGAPYLVLERVSGETLAERLQRGPMPLETVIDAAGQIIAGLEEAHAKGVIHRDLKPSNVMLTPEGRVKLVDFGLAKTVGAGAATDDSAGPITAAGVVLGTARYMSPEQVRGESVDARSDVWAFGCVLYEMLTARPVFNGGSVSEVVAAVLRDAPDWTAIPAAAPASVHRLLQRCLRRDPRIRLQHIGDARLELLDAEADAGVSDVVAAGSPRWRRWSLAAAAAVAVSAGAFAAYLWGSRAEPPLAARLSVELPAGMTLASDFPAPFAIAPAGSPLVFEAVAGDRQQLFVRGLTDPALRALPGTEDARQPFFSPDGVWVGFFANRKLMKVPVAGGAVLQIADIGGNPRGAAWSTDGSIVVAPSLTSGLVRVSENGGALAPLTQIDQARGESSHRWPDVLPGGQWVIFTVGFEDAPYDEGRIEAVSVATGERRLLVSDAGFARYAPDGRILFIRGGRIHAVDFDRQTLSVMSAPEVVLDPVRYDWRNGGGHLAVSAAGMIVYSPGAPNSSEYYLAWGQRDGQLTRATDTPRPFRDIEVGPDGGRIAAIIGTSTESDLWIVDPNGTLSRATFQLSPHRPAWTPRGDRIAVGARRNDHWQLVAVTANNGHTQTTLFESVSRLYPNGWSPDGRFLLFQELRPDTGWDLQILEVDAEGRPLGARVFANTPFHESSAAISLDGKWVAYESDELDGVVEIYIRSFVDGTRKVRVSRFGGRWPRWDAAGNLHYWQTGNDSLQVVPTREADGQLEIGAPGPVWAESTAEAVLRRAVITIGGARFDVDRAGTRLLMLERSIGAAPTLFANPVVVMGQPAARGR